MKGFNSRMIVGKFVGEIPIFYYIIKFSHSNEKNWDLVENDFNCTISVERI